jgi:hypothetical protein
VSREVQQAFDGEKPVVPFRIENVAPEKSLRYYMGSVHWLDALTTPVEQHLEHLAVAVQALLTATVPDADVQKEHMLSGTAADKKAKQERLVREAEEWRREETAHSTKDAETRQRAAEEEQRKGQVASRAGEKVDEEQGAAAALAETQVMEARRLRDDAEQSHRAENRARALHRPTESRRGRRLSILLTVGIMGLSIFGTFMWVAYRNPAAVTMPRPSSSADTPNDGWIVSCDKICYLRFDNYINGKHASGFEYHLYSNEPNVLFSLLIRESNTPAPGEGRFLELSIDGMNFDEVQPISSPGGRVGHLYGCPEGACVGTAYMSANVLNKAKDGTTLEISSVDEGGKPLVWSFPLKGFKEALDKATWQFCFPTFWRCL